MSLEDYIRKQEESLKGTRAEAEEKGKDSEDADEAVQG